MRLTSVDAVNTNNTYYNGYFISPHKKEQFDSFMYILSNQKQDLYIFITNPGCYEDIYRIASNLGILRVFIFPCSMDTTYISDLVRLSDSLAGLKQEFKIIFPESLDNYKLLNHRFVHNCMITDYFLQEQKENSIICQFKPTFGESHMYDIIVDDGKKTRILCPYIDMTKLEVLNKDPRIDEIHVNYSKTYCTDSLSFRGIAHTPKKTEDMKKLKIAAYSNLTELNEAKRIYSQYMTEVRYCDTL